MIFACLVASTFVRQGMELGTIHVVHGKCFITYAADSRHKNWPLPEGVLHRRLPIHVGDRISAAAKSCVRGTYEDQDLLVGPGEAFLAPRIYHGGSKSQYVTARRKMGQGNDRRMPISLSIWPPSKEAPCLYVDSEGVLDLAWIAPPSVRSVSVSIISGGKTVCGDRTILSRSIARIATLGYLRSRRLGLELYKDIQESVRGSATLRLVADTGLTQTVNVNLASKQESQLLDPLVESISGSLAKTGDETNDWYVDWNNLLLAAQDESTPLCGYWIFRAWITYPNAYISADAMRSLSQDADLDQLAQAFDSAQGSGKK